MKFTPQTLEKICYSNIANLIIKYYHARYITNHRINTGEIRRYNFDFYKIIFTLYKNGLPGQFCIEVYKEIIRQYRDNEDFFFDNDLSFEQIVVELKKSPVIRTLKEVTEYMNENLSYELNKFFAEPPFDYETFVSEYFKDYGEFD